MPAHQGTRRRILVAVEPVVLEGALAALLAGEAAEVVQLHQATPGDRTSTYDAAIVTSGLLPGVRSEVLITLPDTRAGAGLVLIEVGGTSRQVQVRTSEEVVGLLACAAPPPSPPRP